MHFTASRLVLSERSHISACFTVVHMHSAVITPHTQHSRGQMIDVSLLVSLFIIQNRTLEVDSVSQTYVLTWLFIQF